MNKKFGEIIFFLRNDILKMSRSQFEKFSNIPNITIQKWEYGKTEPHKWNQKFIIDGLIKKIYQEYSRCIYVDISDSEFEELEKIKNI